MRSFVYSALFGLFAVFVFAGAKPASALPASAFNHVQPQASADIIQVGKRGRYYRPYNYRRNYYRPYNYRRNYYRSPRYYRPYYRSYRPYYRPYYYGRGFGIRIG